MVARRIGGVVPGSAGTLLRCAILLSVLLTACLVVEAKPQRVHSKGILYTLELTPPGADAPERLCIDPGREAWLDAAWGRGDRPAIRSGRGLRWAYVRDTRKGKMHATLFLEVEPLDGKTFEEVADSYRARLKSVWDRAGVVLERLVREKPSRQMTLCGSRVRGRRLLQEVRERKSGRRSSASTVLFPLHGHLVVLTGFGEGDVVPTALRSLAPPPKRWDAEMHPHHCVDFVGEHVKATFFVLSLPVGFAIVPGTPAIDDSLLVNRWKRAPADAPTETVTLFRMSLVQNITAKDALGQWVMPRKAAGLEAEEPLPFVLDGTEGCALDYSRAAIDDVEGGRGVLIAWRSGYAVYALHWETTEMEEEAAAQARAAFILALQKAKTWSVSPPP